MRDYRRRPLLAFVVSVGFPALGVVAFDWTPEVVGTLYWLELFVAAAWVAVAGLFTRRRASFDFDVGILDVSFEGLTQKRGGFDTPRGLPPAHPRNLPNVITVLTLGGFWAVFGWVVVDPVSLRTVSLLTGGSIAVGVGLIGSRYALETVDVFVREQQFETCSVGPLNRRLIEFAAVLTVIVLLTRIETSEPTALAWLAVGLHVGYVLLRQRPGQLHRWDNPVTRWLGVVPESDPAPEPIRPPDGPAQTSVSADKRSVRLSALVATARSDALLPYWVLIVFGGAVAVLTVVDRGDLVAARATLLPVGVATVVVAVTLVPLKLTEYTVQHGAMEYRVYEGQIVGYDRRLGSVQWAVPVTPSTDVTRRRVYADRVRDTQTLTVEPGRDAQTLTADPDRNTRTSTVNSTTDTQTLAHISGHELTELTRHTRLSE